MEKLILNLNGLGCASCAAKIEDRAGKITGLQNVIVDVSKSKLISYYDKGDPNAFVHQIKNIVKELEPHVVVEIAENATSKASKTPYRHDVKTLIRLGSALALLLLGILAKTNPVFYFGLLMASYLIAGHKVLWRSIQNIRKGQIFDEHFLMSIATLGAIAIGEYPEAVAVMIFYEVGEYFQSMAVAKSKNAIGALMDIRPDFALVNRSGFWTKVDPSEVSVGEVIMVKPGERVPLDGIITQGEAFLDTAALTGESVPRKFKSKDAVLSGSLVKDKVLQIEVSSSFAQSTVSRILDLVENATANKAPTEQFITRFARYYTPVVVASAALLAILPPFVLGLGTFQEWLYTGLVFLVISCPCALVVSVPLTFFSGIGNASKNGILIKGSNYLEALSALDAVVFDKTGTLTEGTFKVSRVLTDKDTSHLIRLAALAEMHSNHPIAKSIIEHYGKPLDVSELLDFEEISGHGIKAHTSKGSLLVGNRQLLKTNGIDAPLIDSPNTVVYVAENQTYLGAIEIKDQIKPDAASTVSALNDMNLATIMLTGDRLACAEEVGSQLKMQTIYAELLPEDKYNHVKDLIDSGKRVAFLGDGINDAPVLAGATVGISMGAIGSDSAIEASDVVLMTDEPHKLIRAIEISKKTKQIVIQNIAFALGIKFLIMGLGIFGITSMWMAIFADVGVTLIAVLNAMRAMR